MRQSLTAGNVYWAYCLVRNNMESCQYVLLVCFDDNTVVAWRLIGMLYLSPVVYFPFYWFSFTITPFNCDYCIHHDLQLKNYVVKFLASRKCQTVNYGVEFLLHLSKSNLQSKWKQVFRLIYSVDAISTVLVAINIFPIVPHRFYIVMPSLSHPSQLVLGSVSPVVAIFKFFVVLSPFVEILLYT